MEGKLVRLFHNPVFNEVFIVINTVIGDIPFLLGQVEYLFNEPITQRTYRNPRCVWG